MFFIVVILFGVQVYRLSPRFICEYKGTTIYDTAKKNGGKFSTGVGCDVDKSIWWGVDIGVPLPGTGDGVGNYPFTQSLSKIPLGITPPLTGRLRV